MISYLCISSRKLYYVSVNIYRCKSNVYIRLEHFFDIDSFLLIGRKLLCLFVSLVDQKSASCFGVIVRGPEQCRAGRSNNLSQIDLAMAIPLASYHHFLDIKPAYFI